MGYLSTIGLLFGIAAVGLFVTQRYFGIARNLQPAIFLLLSSQCWIFAGIYYVGLVLLIFSALSLLTVKKLVICFMEEGILYPSFPVRLINWNEVDFVVLKDDILSIELKNNKLMQFTLENNATQGLEAGEFNAYCAGRTAD